MKKISVCVVEDQSLFRDGLGSLIEQSDTLELAGKFAHGEMFLEALKGFDAAETFIALVDMQMPGISGVQLTIALQQQFPKVKVIILSVHDSPLHILHAIDAGAAAYLEKGCNFDEIVETIEKVYHNGYYHSNYVQKIIKVSQENLQEHANDQLPAKTDSNQEKVVLKLICKELSSAEIANKLNLSTRTIENHRNNLLEKTNSRNTAGLVLYAIRHNLFLPLGK